MSAITLRCLARCARALIVLWMVAILAACGAPQAAAPTQPPPTNTPAPTNTPLPPTATPRPTDTPIPPTPTATATATPIPPTPTPTPLAITAEALLAQHQDTCQTDVVITGATGDKLQIQLKVFTINNNQMVTIFCPGARHTWSGTIPFAGFIFSSDGSDPLQFVVDKDKGYVYDTGKGSITHPDGTVVVLGYPPAPGDLPAITEVIRLSTAKGAEKLMLEVVEGRYQLAGGDILLAGSSMEVAEDWLALKPGLAIDIGPGGATVQGNLYPQGLRLVVDASGALVPVAP